MYSTSLNKFLNIYTIAHLTNPHTANPASNVPFPNLLNACASLCPGATHVTLWPRRRMYSTVALSYAHLKLTWLGIS